MPDQFKKFLQSHRTELDTHSVPKDLFKEIMDKSFPLSQSKPKIVRGNFRTYFLPLLSIAAVGLILCIVYFGLNSKDTLSLPTIVHNQSQTELHSTVPSPNTEQIENNPIIKNTQSLIVSDHKVDKAESVVVTNEQLNTLKDKSIASLNKKFNRKSIIALENTPVNLKVNEALNKVIPEFENSSYKSIDEKKVDAITSLTLENVALEQTTKSITAIEGKPNVSIKPRISTTPVVTFNNERGMQTLDQKIKKGFFNFLSKNSRKWSNNTLAIDPIEQDQSTHLAIAFKNSQVEFNKSLKFNFNQ